MGFGSGFGQGSDVGAFFQSGKWFGVEWLALLDVARELRGEVSLAATSRTEREACKTP